MKHFKRLKKDIDVEPFLGELRSFSSEWDTLRARFFPAHRETLDIPLRSGVQVPGKSLQDSQQVVDTPQCGSFSKLISFIEQFAAEEGGELSRVMIVTLRPKGKVYRHRDEGEYYRVRNRYHLVLFSPHGSDMRIEEERVIFQPGELWWYNNKSFHESYNDSDNERVHVIFDVLPVSLWHRLLRKTGLYLRAPSDA